MEGLSGNRGVKLRIIAGLLGASGLLIGLGACSSEGDAPGGIVDDGAEVVECVEVTANPGDGGIDVVAQGALAIAGEQSDTSITEVGNELAENTQGFIPEGAVAEVCASRTDVTTAHLANN